MFGSARKWMVTLLVAGTVGFAGSVYAEGAAEEGVPLGDAVAAKEQAYAKGVSLPAFTLGGVELKQDRAQPIPDDFKTPASRKCKPFCEQPEKVDGADTVKLEDFPKMAGDINAGKIVFLDMRTEDWYAKGTIPGSHNLPYSDLTGKETKAQAKLKKLEGKEVIAFCNGWWCGQSPTGIKAMVGLKYPGKIHYFRGGVQDWLDAGLPLVKP